MRDPSAPPAFVPERLLLPPPPRDPVLRERWSSLPFAERRRLARSSVDPHRDPPPKDRALVAALARARVATAWRGVAGALVLGWLVLMTVWGFGRSAAPAHAVVFLLTGAAGGVTAAAAAVLQARRRVRRAAAVAAACADPVGGTSRPPHPSQEP